MYLVPLLLSCLSGRRSDRRRTRVTTPRRPHHWLRLDTLEDRTVLSTWIVTSAADDGSAGTLRTVLAGVQNGDTVRFSNSLKHQTISLTQGALFVPASVSIEGHGAGKLTIDGNFQDRVLVTGPGTTVSVSGMTLTHGSSFYGGAIQNLGTLTLDDTAVVNNRGAFGGAIINDAGASALTVTDSTISNNTADASFFGSSYAFGGAIYGGSVTVTITDSTIADNTATTVFG